MTGLARRTASVTIMAALLLAAAFFLPSAGVCALLALIAVVAMAEFYALLAKAGIPSFNVLGTAGGVAIIVATWVVLNHLNGSTLKGAEWEQLALFLTVLAVLIRLFPQKNNAQPLPTVACTLLGVLYVAMLFNFFTKLAFSWDPPSSPGKPVGAVGRTLALYLIAVVKFSDVSAYFVGTRFGRHKLIPRISPGKTWEGFFGGIAGGFVAGMVFFLFSQDLFARVEMGWGKALALSALLPIIGVAGDLTESMLKRAASVKDSGGVIPGMGGVLDLLDSLLFAAPAMYFFIKLLGST